MRAVAAFLWAVAYSTALSASAAAAPAESTAVTRSTATRGSTAEPAGALLAHVGAAELALLAETLPDARAHLAAAMSLLTSLIGVRDTSTAASPTVRLEAQAGTRRVQTWLPLADGGFIEHGMAAKPMHGHESSHLRVTDARVVHVQLAVDLEHARDALGAADRAVAAAHLDEARGALQRARAAFVITETPVASPTVAALENLRLARAWLRAADPTAAAASLEHVTEALARIRAVTDGTPTAARLHALKRDVSVLTRTLSRRHAGDVAHAPGTLDAWIAELERWPLH